MIGKKNITQGIIFIVLAGVIPIIAWIVAEATTGENLDILLVFYNFILPVSIAVGVLFFVVGISCFIPHTGKRKKSIDKSEEVWECEKCGAEIAETDKACTKCGVEFEGE